MNRLTRAHVLALTGVLEELQGESVRRRGPLDQTEFRKPLIIAGNERYFSVGADLNEISQLTGAGAFEFAKMGQRLMNLVDNFPAPVYAAISGYCMGGGLDLALACDFRICAANAVFGHSRRRIGADLRMGRYPKAAETRRSR